MEKNELFKEKMYKKFSINGLLKEILLDIINKE